MYIEYAFTRQAITFVYDVIENHFEASGMSQTLRKAAKYSFYSFLYLTLTFDLSPQGK